MGELPFSLIFAGIVSYNFGGEFARGFLHMNDPFLGGMVLFVISMFVGLWLWRGPIHNHIQDSKANRAKNTHKRLVKKSAQPLGHLQDLRGVINAGTTLVYEGLVNRDFHYQLDAKGMRTERIATVFTLKRNTLAMTDRERDAIEIMERLDCHGFLGKSSDEIRFAMMWGDSRCDVTGPDFKAEQKLVAQNGIRNLKSLVTLEAETRCISVEGAITTLFTLLQGAANAPKAPEPIKALLQRMQRPPSPDGAPSIWR